PVIVIIALEFEIAEDFLGRLEAPVGEQHDVIAVESLAVPTLGLDDDCTVEPRLLLKHRMAVVPISPALMHWKPVDKSLAGRDPAEAEPGYAVHSRGRAYAVPMDRALLVQPISDGQCNSIALTPTQDRGGNLAVDPGRRGPTLADGQRNRFDLELKFSAGEKQRAA